MKKEVFEIDANGYIVEKYVAEADEQGNFLEELSENIVTKQPTQGLYRARWTGIKWIEDMAQEEIDALNNQPKPLTENEMLMLAIADLDLQRENDKTETQLVIADLAETILGGM